MARDNISGIPFRLSWGAIFGGMFAASGLWLLLHVLGLALGFSTLEPTEPSNLRAIGIGGGIWSVVGSMIALFIGGLVTARSAGYLGRGNGALHGVVLWGLTTIGGTVLLISVLGALARGAVGIGVEVAGVAASGAGQVPSAMGALDIDAQDFVGPVNERLTRAGKPTVTAEQLQAALQDAVQRSVREGRFDRNVFMTSIARHTALSPSDVRDVFGETEQQLSQQLSQLGQRVGETAERAAEATGRMFWGLFGLLALSLIASVLGAITGVSRRQREVSTQVAPLPPITRRPGEVY